MKETIVRAITFPIASPGVPWEEFRADANAIWRESTRLANWAVTQLALAEETRKPGDKKLGKMPPIYLYGLAKKKYPGWVAWSGCYSSAQSLMRGVEAKYRKQRIDVIWRCAASLPRYRYPHPYPIHNQNWSAEIVDGVPYVSMTINGKKHRLRLRGGPEFKRQLVGLREIASGKAEKCEAALYNKGGHVMVKLVARFAKPETKAGRTMLICSDPNALLVCEMEGRREWILNGDEIKGRIERHRIFLQRVSEDSKAERRMGQSPNRNIASAREQRCEKQNNYLDSKTHEITAMIVRFAARQGVGELIYNDSIRGFMPSFPWHQMSIKLGYKLQAAGIAFTHSGGTEANGREVCPTVQEASEQNRMVRRLARAMNRGPSKSHGKVSVTPPSTNGSGRRRQPTS